MKTHFPKRIPISLFFLFLMLLPQSSCPAQEEQVSVPLPQQLLMALESDLSHLPTSDLMKACKAEPDYGLAALQNLRKAQKDGQIPKNAELTDGLTAEILWRLFADKKWSDPLCEMAADLLASPDPAAVSYADWALAMRVGWENSSETVPWREDLDPKPDWFAKWLSVPADRFAELDYWRVVLPHRVHASLPPLKGSAAKFLERAEGSMNASLASGRLTDAQRSDLLAKHEQAKALLEEIRRSTDLLAARQLFSRLRIALRPLILANPDLDFQQILFTKRHSAHGLRNITGSQYPWTHKPGGDLCVKTGFRPQDPVREILQGQLGPGHVHGTDLHWDADRIVFGYAQQPHWPLPKPTHTANAHFFFELRPQTPPTHLYEIRLDGTGLRQITSDPYWGDFEPTYASDGSIVFVSDRSSRSSECGNFGADHTVMNLFRCEPDGSGLRMLSNNKDVDRYPHALSNGLVGYTRWEYQERHFTEVHAFWTIHPDGTYAEAAFKQHLRVPWGLRDVRDVPNSNRYVAVATGHHTLAYGQLVLFDLLGGPNDETRLFTLTPRLTPGEGPAVTRTVPEGGLIDSMGRYSGPFPISETTFLASWSGCTPAHDGRLGGDSQFAIYLIDVFGNRELIHRDRILSCDFATPVRPRRRPYEIADGRILANPQASGSAPNASSTAPNASGATSQTPKESQLAENEFPHPIAYVSNVNVGLPASEQGKAKFLRIMQRVGWPMDQQIGAMRWAPGNAWEQIFGFWSWAPAREIGTVPVEADGSCWFYVPPNQSVYFQLLDENHLEIRRMRSHVSLEKGECRGCVGCHETRPMAVAPKPGALPLAFLHSPLIPEEPSWGSENLLSYEDHIQPIFDRRCVSCHSPSNPEGPAAPAARFDLSREMDPKTGMMRSYSSLFPDGRRSGALVPSDEHPLMISVSNKHSGAGISKPREFGSSRSQLIRELLEDPLHAREVRPQMTDEEWLLLVTWIDANAPYYATFFNRRNPQTPSPKRSIRRTFPISFHE